jgi:hypothetical protein
MPPCTHQHKRACMLYLFSITGRFDMAGWIGGVGIGAGF